MKKLFLSLMALTSLTVVAQNPTVPSVTENVVEDFKSASTNQENKQYPMINSQRMVRAQITAPTATFVGLDIAGKIYAMTKDENGVWTGTSEPQDEGLSIRLIPTRSSPCSTCSMAWVRTRRAGVPRVRQASSWTT